MEIHGITKVHSELWHDVLLTQCRISTMFFTRIVLFYFLNVSLLVSMRWPNEYNLLLQRLIIIFSWSHTVHLCMCAPDILTSPQHITKPPMTLSPTHVVKGCATGVSVNAAHSTIKCFLNTTGDRAQLLASVGHFQCKSAAAGMDHFHKDVMVSYIIHTKCNLYCRLLIPYFLK